MDFPPDWAPEFGLRIMFSRSRFRVRVLHASPRPDEGAVVAGLLVRVADDGGMTARKLVWLGPAGEVHAVCGHLEPREAPARCG